MILSINGRILIVALFALLCVSLQGTKVDAATDAEMSCEMVQALSAIGAGNCSTSGTTAPTPTTPTAPPTPTAPVQTVWDYTKNGLTIKSSCAPFAGEGADLICPKSETSFEYVGGVDPAQSAIAPEGNDHNLGIWRRTVGGASVCGIKSRPGSTPPLAFQGGDHMWILPNCPETANQVLQRIGADCASENANFLNNLVLQEGSQSYCIPYMKAFYKIILLKQYYPTTWKDPDGIYNAATAQETKDFQGSMATALQAYNFEANDETKAAKQTYLNSGMATAGSDGKLTLAENGKFAKAEWSWLTVFTYLYLIANGSKTTY